MVLSLVHYLKLISICLNYFCHNLCVFWQAKLRTIAIKMTANISSLVRDFFHNPPSYSTKIQLSWGPKVKHCYNNYNNATYVI